MIGDSNVFVASIFSGLGHLLDGMNTVARSGMRVQLAPNIRGRDQYRERAVCRSRYFIATFAEFGIDEAQSVIRIECFFIRESRLFEPACASRKADELPQMRFRAGTKNHS